MYQPGDEVNGWRIMERTGHQFTYSCTMCSTVKRTTLKYMHQTPCRTCYPLPPRCYDYLGRTRTWAPGDVMSGWWIIRVLGKNKYNIHIVQIACVRCDYRDQSDISNLRSHGRVCRGCHPHRTKPTVAWRLKEATRVKWEISDTGRKCLGCGEWKPWEMFNSRLQTSTGYDARCRPCMRLYEAMRRLKKSKNQLAKYV